MPAKNTPSAAAKISGAQAKATPTPSAKKAPGSSPSKTPAEPKAATTKPAKAPKKAT
ncbi:hypothetical protein GALMADRAFT_139384 [Galerina marginata CBS 339.88]|uniref:Uncharacterized protein n=1 Tax=Galerina marginata (strain CBS 339.88) TaxID=685588 RepID=A0A067SZW7_GALM3|nr:hypothetical protein GALMADRAFT_139384 [Galerina marginata CBS 339.88]